MRNSLGWYGKASTYNDKHVRNPREFVLEIKHVAISPTTLAINNDKGNRIKRTNEEWKDAWYDLYDWVEFKKDLRREFYKTCREGDGKLVYAREDSTNVKVLAL